MRFEINVMSELCANCMAPWLSLKTSEHGIHILKGKKRQLCFKKVVSVTLSDEATYAASVLESVACF